LTIKSTSHTFLTIYPPSPVVPCFDQGTPSSGEQTADATFLIALTFKTCVLYARQYSVVKDLDCLSNQ